MNAQKLNNLIGWIIFLISLTVYLLTLEPTVSLWDCGEFLTSAYKLEINHSPGAPLFMLLGRVFSLLSVENQAKAALAINSISAVASAATVLFLYWTMVWLITQMESRQTKSYPLLVKFGASAIAALTFAFTDSFWFSAVEAEVYALSSLFSAIVLWAATRWEREADDPYSLRWIVLISFLIGLSIGVHLLNLLVIPSVGLIIYFRKFSYSIKGLLITIAISATGIILLLHVFIPGILDISKNLELYFVNTLRFPVNSGLISYLVILSGLIIWGIIYSHHKQNKPLNLALLCLTFLMIGYTSYTATIIRASAGVPVNQGNPDSGFSLLNYLNREQYGSRPVLYGANMGSIVAGYRERTTWIARDGRYEKSKLNPDVEYEPSTIGFFPRMHSHEPEHIEVYKNQTGFKGRKIETTDKEGNIVETVVPTFSENLQFFLKYQLGYMYFRYLMWNFTGRQNDIQGDGSPLNGNWQSGIHIIDEAVCGPQNHIPTTLAENKGRNSYYFLPLILGLAGLLFHYRKDRPGFLIISLLFFLMSFTLVVYLNEVPNTPRERDYVYVGSFYVFSMWVGFGVLALFRALQKAGLQQKAGFWAVVAGLSLSPALLLAQNYDDHDRSGRYSARDLARNYLESCEPNAILFTHADNDTYPLWYCQEVEGIRRDVRVVVMPYLSAEWYIGQLQRKVYSNEPLKLKIPLSKYQSETTDFVYVIPKIETEQLMTDVLDFVASDSSKTKLSTADGHQISYIPANKVIIPQQNGVPIHVSIDQKGISKGDLAFWDIITTNAGKRPVCFTAWYDAAEHGLKNNLIFDGLVYRLTSDTTSCTTILNSGKIDTESLYRRLMIRCKWDNLSKPNIYFDWHHRRMLASMQIRNAFYRLASKLTQEQQTAKALNVIKKAEQTISLNLWPTDYQSILMAALYAPNGQKKQGEEQFRKLASDLEEKLEYYTQFTSEKKESIRSDAEYQLSLYNELIKQATNTLDVKELDEMKNRLIRFAEKLS